MDVSPRLAMSSEKNALLTSGRCREWTPSHFVTTQREVTEWEEIDIGIKGVSKMRLLTVSRDNATGADAN
jgi:hypothetical protein